ncbi:hypothetical protein CGRA01v4_11629 [Colletotrichum graminicola]|nr:hypothetical protein CGRA01v4_11629 [Colletotrichum graminicola]
MFPFQSPQCNNAPFPMMRHREIRHCKEREREREKNKEKNEERPKPSPMSIPIFSLEPSRGMQNRLETCNVDSTLWRSGEECRMMEMATTSGNGRLWVGRRPSWTCLLPRLPGKRRARSPCAQPRASRARAVSAAPLVRWFGNV